MDNRELISKMFETLSGPLEIYITETIRKSDPKLAKRWPDLVRQYDTAKRETASTMKYYSTDPSIQLRMLYTPKITTEHRQNWRPFTLNRTAKSSARILKEIRDKWAHFDPFTSKESWVALENCEYLLTEIGAETEAKQVSHLKSSLQNQLRNQLIKCKTCGRRTLETTSTCISCAGKEQRKDPNALDATRLCADCGSPFITYSHIEWFKKRDYHIPKTHQAIKTSCPPPPTPAGFWIRLKSRLFGQNSTNKY